MRVKCEQGCPNNATHYYQGEYYCYPHYLAVTADGQLLSEVTQHLS
jgi:hypothetical protein